MICFIFTISIMKINFNASSRYWYNGVAFVAGVVCVRRQQPVDAPSERTGKELYLSLVKDKIN
jgi:hypothetical protein